MSQRSSTILGVAFLLLAIFLRFWNLDSFSLWIDEQDSLMQSRNLSEIWPRRGNGVLYSVVLHFWQLLFGSTAFSIRFLSASLGVIVVIALAAIVYRITRNRLATVLTLWLSAILPILVWHSRDARMYPLWAVGCLISFYALIRIQERGFSTRDLIEYNLGQAIALLSHTFHVFYLPAFVFASYLMCQGKASRRDYVWLQMPLILLVGLFGIRLLDLAHSPHYFQQHAVTSFDLRLLPSLFDTFFYTNPAQSVSKNFGLGFLVSLVLLFLSSLVWRNQQISRNVRLSVLILFWVPFIIVHVLPVRDYARLFYPAVCFGLILTGVALAFESASNPERRIAPWMAGAVCVFSILLFPSLKKSLTVDMEPWKQACSYLETLPEEWLVVSELGHPESPLQQCVRLRHPKLTRWSQRDDLKTFAAKIKAHERFVIFYSPPWVRKEASVLSKFPAEQYTQREMPWGPYLKSIFVEKKKLDITKKASRRKSR